MKKTLDLPTPPPELDEPKTEEERHELLAQELREAIRRKLAPVEAPA